MVNILLRPTSHSSITAGHIGSVIDVIKGYVPESLAHRRFNADAFKYGFELASSEDVNAFGEAVLVNGFCYSTSTNQQSKNYLQTTAGESFVTSGLFLIPKEAEPTYRIQQSFTESCLLHDAYSAIFAQVKQPFAIAAMFEFETLTGNFIVKPPIHGENIIENIEKFCPYPPQTISTTSAFLVGAVADFSDTRYKDLLEKLNVVLYKNPFDKQLNITTHTHCITLKKDLDDVQDITPILVDKTLHVLSEQSRIKSIKGEVFAVGDMMDFASC